MAMTGLLDTNVVLYLLGGRLVEPLLEGVYGISVITEMELLSWPSLTSTEEASVRQFLATVVLCELTGRIRAGAVRLRRDYRLKLPDAIICATALEHRVDLWTNDACLLDIAGVRCRSVLLQA